MDKCVEVVSFISGFEPVQKQLSESNSDEIGTESSNDFSADDSIADPDYSTRSDSSDEDNIATTSIITTTVTASIQTSAEETTNSRKRKANPSVWRKNLAKQARNSGKAYTSSSKSKKIIEERKLGPSCNQCRWKCGSKISQDDRKKIFSDYWNLSNLQRQRDFLVTSMEPIAAKYRYPRNDSNRQLNNAFYFTLRNTKHRVCKKFFKSTLGITDRPIRTVIKKKTLFTGGMITEDLRGRHDKHYRIDDTIKNEIREHINSIPRIESHYRRSDSNRQFIDGGKSLAELHRDYVNVCEEKGQPYANYLMYSRIFNYEFNISFFSPKKDQCEDCVNFANATVEEKEQLRAKYDMHLKEKDLSRIEKDNDKKSSDRATVVAVYDLQAVLQCPRGDISTFYYASKLNVFNFTIYEMKTHSAKCFVWDESEANRGVCEIGTCVIKYIESLEEVASQTDENQIDLIFYSDNCCGQQKNKFMLSMYLYAVQHFHYIRSITHKFLVKGHSQNEGDSVHAVIERQIKRSLKSGPIYVPNQYATLIRTAKKSGQPYNVQELNYESFLDLKDLGSKMGLNIMKNSNNDIVKLGDIRIVQFTKQHPNTVFYKTSYAQEAFDTINAKPQRKTKSPNIFLKNLYNSKPGFSEKKKESILSLFKKKAIPRYYYNYYNSL